MDFQTKVENNFVAALSNQGKQEKENEWKQRKKMESNRKKFKTKTDGMNCKKNHRFESEITLTPSPICQNYP